MLLMPIVCLFGFFPCLPFSSNKLVFPVYICWEGSICRYTTLPYWSEFLEQGLSHLIYLMVILGPFLLSHYAWNPFELESSCKSCCLTISSIPFWWCGFGWLSLPPWVLVSSSAKWRSESLFLPPHQISGRIVWASATQLNILQFNNYMS